MIRFLLSIFFTFAFYAQVFSQADITTRLYDKMLDSNPTDYIKTLVMLNDQVDLNKLDKQLYEEKALPDRRAKVVITALMDKADKTQTDLLEFFKEKYAQGQVFSFRSFWISNMFAIEARREIINELAFHPDVEMLDLDDELDWDRPSYVGPAESESLLGSEPGLQIIKANQLWALGFTGAGRLVMHIDTGVNVNHPALGPKWRGNNGAMWYHAWFDPIAPTSTLPFDCGSHGTHTMGIMCGMAAGDTVGVAPDAQWIAAGITDCPGSSNPSMNIAAFQWAMNPDSNINTTHDMPDAISCSWQDPNSNPQCSSIYVQTMTALETAGIGVVFSAGNSGPGASTITPPKNINTNEVNIMCVANISGSSYLGGNNNPITSSSSRGPSTCGGIGSLLIKPEVSAPGTSIRSSIPSGYGTMTGTSMASPHVGGAIALLKQVAPNLTGHQIKMALYNSAVDLGTAGEDNTYGMGLIDIYAAYLIILNQIPVELSSFTVNVVRDEVHLNWSTASETNNSGFMIQKKIKSENDWKDRIFINGAGTTTEKIDYSFIDEEKSAGVYQYRLKQIDFDGTVEISDIVEVEITSPVNYTLLQNYPNPFNPTTVIEFSLPEKAQVKMNIYNALGEFVTTLANDFADAGYHRVYFNAIDLPSGLYVYKISAVGETTTFTDSKKMMLVK